MEYSIPDSVMHLADSNFQETGQDDVDSIIRTLNYTVTPMKKKHQPHPIDYLKSVMAERGLLNRDLKAYIGSSGNISAVLNKRKPLTLRMIRNLNTYLDIPADILIQPYDCH